MMTIITPGKTFRLFLAFTLALGMLISAVGASLSHPPTNLELAEQAGYAQLAPQVDGHGHSHEAVELEEQHENHAPGHNPADHSHEIPHLLAYPYSIGGGMTRIHFLDIPESVALGAFARLDRPPRPISSV